MTGLPPITPSVFFEAHEHVQQRLAELAELQQSLTSLAENLQRRILQSGPREIVTAGGNVYDTPHDWREHLLEDVNAVSQMDERDQQVTRDYLSTTLPRLKHVLQQQTRPEDKVHQAEVLVSAVAPTTSTSETTPSRRKRKWPLEHHEYTRYSRQLIMPEIGLQGQLRLKAVKVLIIGAGGLGCPAAAYLAGAGVSRLGLADGDTVEVSNLHRQILHSMNTVGMLKTESAIARLKATNPHVEYVAHSEAIAPTNALELVEQYDLVLDCTDMPSTRYLVSDACVISCKPLVSASALRTSGQLTVFNYPPAPAGTVKADGSPQGGPCYRCVWPKPPPAEAVQSCGEGGILGPVVGVMGVLMATEALKMIASGGLEVASIAAAACRPSMLMYSAMSSRPFQQMKLQPRRTGCASCSDHATVNAASLTSGSLDYVAFCGLRKQVSLLPSEERVTAREYAALLDGGAGTGAQSQHLIDVREKVQFELAHMPGSMNVPWSEIECWKKAEDVGKALKPLLFGAAQHGSIQPSGTTLTFVCREGNDSQLAVEQLKRLSAETSVFDGDTVRVKDMIGGWRAWKREVDGDWPDI